MIDPDLLFLEAYESANTQDELKAFCFQNFGIYDPIMIKLEKEFNKKFLSLSDADLWSRERIKRSEIKKKDKYLSLFYKHCITKRKKSIIFFFGNFICI